MVWKILPITRKERILISSYMNLVILIIKNGYYENLRLQLLTSGRLFSENWNLDSKNVDFFLIKQKVEHILTRLGIKNISSEQINLTAMRLL